MCSTRHTSLPGYKTAFPGQTVWPLHSQCSESRFDNTDCPDKSDRDRPTLFRRVDEGWDVGCGRQLNKPGLRMRDTNLRSRQIQDNWTEPLSLISMRYEPGRRWWGRQTPQDTCTGRGRPIRFRDRSRLRVSPCCDCFVRSLSRSVTGSGTCPRRCSGQRSGLSRRGHLC